MAVMKLRTGDGPLEAVKEGEKIAVRVSTDGGGRPVVGLSPGEAKKLGTKLITVVG